MKIRKPKLLKLPELPMNPLGAAFVASANALGTAVMLYYLFRGDGLGSVLAGVIVGMLVFGILIMD